MAACEDFVDVKRLRWKYQDDPTIYLAGEQ